GPARVARAEVLSIRERDHVAASRVVGMHPLEIALCEVMPNALPPVMALSSVIVAGAVLTEAALSFLGLGVQAPTPEWGIMVAEGARFITTGKWWLVVFPGAALMTAVLCFNLLGDGLRDILDPRMRT
ncbi:MAG: ABC transporter permease, partial [Oceanibaculum sp.]